MIAIITNKVLDNLTIETTATIDAKNSYNSQLLSEGLNKNRQFSSSKWTWNGNKAIIKIITLEANNLKRNILSVQEDLDFYEKTYSNLEKAIEELQ